MADYLRHPLLIVLLAFAAVLCPLSSSAETSARIESVQLARGLYPSDGMTVGPITRVAPSVNGGVWLAGLNGIQYFDGLRFRDLQLVKPLPVATLTRSYWVREAKGYLYFGWDAWVVRVDLQSHVAVRASANGWSDDLAPEPDARQSRFCAAPDVVWTAPRLGALLRRQFIERVDLASGVVHQIPVQDGAVYQTSFGDGLACTNETLITLSRKPFGVFSLSATGEGTPRFTAFAGYESPTERDFQSRIGMVDDDRVVVLHAQGLLVLNLRTGEVTPVLGLDTLRSAPRSLISEDLVDAGELRDRRLWITSRGESSVWELDARSLKPVREFDLRNLPQRNQFEPRPRAELALRLRGLADDLLWVADDDQLFQIRAGGQPAHSDTVHPSDTQMSTIVWALCMTPDGRTWSRNGESIWVNPDALGADNVPGHTRRFIKADLPAIPSYGLACDAADNSLWVVAPPRGLMHIRALADGSLQSTMSDLPVDVNRFYGVFAVTEDWVWITTGKDVLRVNRRTLAPGPAVPAQTDSIILPRLVGVGVAQSIIYVGDEGRLQQRRLDTGTAMLLQGQEVLDSHRPLSDIQIGAQGEVLVLSSSGALLFSPDPQRVAFRRIDRATYPPGLRFYCMRTSADGRIWMSSSNGLAMVDPGSGNVQRLGRPDGVMWGDFNQFSCAMRHDGQLVFGAIKGWTTVDPRVPLSIPAPPRVQLAAYAISGRPALPWLGGGTPRISLHYPESLLRLEFSVAQAIGGGEGRLRYRLDGVDAGWREGSLGQPIEYGGLDDMSTQLRVQAAFNGGAWGDELTLPISVVPPWYRTRSILALYAFVLLSLASVGVWRWRQGQLQRQRNLQLIEARNNLQRLSELGRQVMASLDSDVIVETLRTGLSTLMRADGLLILQADANGRLQPIDASALTPDDTNDHVHALQQCLTGSKVMSMTRSLTDPVWPTASIGTRSALVAPLIFQQGHIGLLVVYSTEPTPRGATESALLETLALHVASAISNSRAYAQLRQAQEQLVEREKMAALGSMVAGVAHELNTPLGNALLLTTTLNDRAREEGEGSGRAQEPAQALSELRKLVGHAGEMIERSLRSAASLMSSFKQVAADQTADRRRSFDLARTVGELMATMHGQLQAQHHELVLQIPAGIEMDGYPGALSQVLTNLTVNALKHGFEDRTGGCIVIRATVLAGEVAIEFIDNGRGIDEAYRAHVFEPFFTTRLGRGGTGLGLSVSYNIVTSLLGGSIEVSSISGSGTTFRMRIPIQVPLRESRPPQPAPG